MTALKARARDPVARKRAGPFGVAFRIADTLRQNERANLSAWCRALARQKRASTPPLPPHAVVAIVAVLGAAAASMFLMDAAASAWAHSLPDWFNAAFGRITRLGLSGWFLVPSAFAVLCLAALVSQTLPRMTQGVLAAFAARWGFLFVAVAAPGLFTSLAKGMIGRARPNVGAHDNPFFYEPLVWKSAYASLPSGHATTVAAAAMAIGAIFPRARWAMWAYALLVMFSRVVVFAHHPSDVLAGAVVGAAGAALVRRHFAARGLVFRARDLSPRPGPSGRRIATALRRALSIRYLSPGSPGVPPIEPAPNGL